MGFTEAGETTFGTNTPFTESGLPAFTSNGLTQNGLVAFDLIFNASTTGSFGVAFSASESQPSQSVTGSFNFGFSGHTNTPIYLDELGEMVFGSSKLVVETGATAFRSSFLTESGRFIFNVPSVNASASGTFGIGFVATETEPTQSANGSFGEGWSGQTQTSQSVTGTFDEAWAGTAVASSSALANGSFGVGFSGVASAPSGSAGVRSSGASVIKWFSDPQAQKV